MTFADRLLDLIPTDQTGVTELITEMVSSNLISVLSVSGAVLLGLAALLFGRVSRMFKRISVRGKIDELTASSKSPLIVLVAEPIGYGLGMKATEQRIDHRDELMGIIEESLQTLLPKSSVRSFSYPKIFSWRRGMSASEAALKLNKAANRTLEKAKADLIVIPRKLQEKTGVLVLPVGDAGVQYFSMFLETTDEKLKTIREKLGLASAFFAANTLLEGAAPYADWSSRQRVAFLSKLTEFVVNPPAELRNQPAFADMRKAFETCADLALRRDFLPRPLVDAAETIFRQSIETATDEAAARQAKLSLFISQIALGPNNEAAKMFIELVDGQTDDIAAEAVCYWDRLSHASVEDEDLVHPELFTNFTNVVHKFWAEVSAETPGRPWIAAAIVVMARVFGQSPERETRSVGLRTARAYRDIWEAIADDDPGIHAKCFEAWVDATLFDIQSGYRVENTIGEIMAMAKEIVELERDCEIRSIQSTNPLARFFLLRAHESTVTAMRRMQRGVPDAAFPTSEWIHNKIVRISEACCKTTMDDPSRNFYVASHENKAVALFMRGEENGSVADIERAVEVFDLLLKESLSDRSTETILMEQAAACGAIARVRLGGRDPLSSEQLDQTYKDLAKALKTLTDLLQKRKDNMHPNNAGVLYQHRGDGRKLLAEVLFRKDQSRFSSEFFKLLLDAHFDKALAAWQFIEARKIPASKRLTEEAQNVMIEIRGYLENDSVEIDFDLPLAIKELEKERRLEEEPLVIPFLESWGARRDLRTKNAEPDDVNKPGPDDEQAGLDDPASDADQR